MTTPETVGEPFFLRQLRQHSRLGMQSLYTTDVIHVCDMPEIINYIDTLTARVREVEAQLTAATERAEKVAFVLEAAQAVGDDANEWTDGEHVVKSRFVHALRAALAAAAPTEPTTQENV